MEPVRGSGVGRGVGKKRGRGITRGKQGFGSRVSGRDRVSPEPDSQVTVGARIGGLRSARRHRLAANDNDEEAVKRNLGHAREKWASMRRFLIQDDVRPKTMAVFHRTVVLCVPLCGSESWVMTKDLVHELNLVELSTPAARRIRPHFH